MAATIRRLSNTILGGCHNLSNSTLTPTPLSSSSSPIFHSTATLLIQRRGIASKLFVGGLSFYTTEKGLSEAFSRYGQVLEAKILMGRVSARSKGFGFVTYASIDEARNALAEMNGKNLDGRAIFVDIAKPSIRDRTGGLPTARGPPEPVPKE